MDTSFDGYVEHFDTSYSGNGPFNEITANPFLNSTGTTILEEDIEIDTTRYFDNEVGLSEKILEIKSEFTQRTSASGLADAALPKSIPLITGIGALEFINELDNLEYSEDVKNIYKGSRELIKKLNIL